MTGERLFDYLDLMRKLLIVIPVPRPVTGATGVCSCNGYLGHPFLKKTPWAFITRLFLVVRWYSATDREGEWFS